jgi:hypothetical protein
MQNIGRLKVETSNPEVCGYQAQIGLVAGLFAQAGFAVIQATVDAKDSVYGITLILLGQLSGLAIGLSVTGALFTNLAKVSLQTVFPIVEESTLILIVAGTSGGFPETQSDAKQMQALIVIVNVLHDVLTEVYVVAALAVFLSVFLKVLLPSHCRAQANKIPVKKCIHRRFCWWNVVI